MNCRVLRSLVLSSALLPSTFSPSSGTNNNDIQLAICNYLFTQRGLMLIDSSKMCMCVCEWDENVKSHSDLKSLHTFFFPVGPFTPSYSRFAVKFSVSVICVTEGGGAHSLLKWDHPEPVWSPKGARQSYSASTGIAVYLCIHTRVHTHICVCQLIITNCSSHQALAKWQSLSDVLRPAFLQTHTHAASLVKVLIVHLCVHACVCMCTQSLSLHTFSSSLHQSLSTL